MVQAYSDNITASTNSIIPFTNVIIEKGSTATMVNNSIQLNAKGVYEVKFNASFTPAEAGDITIQLYINGLPYAPAKVTVSATVGNSFSIPFQTLVPVSHNTTPCCSSLPDVLTVMCTGVGVSGSDNIVVTKIC